MSVYTDIESGVKELLPTVMPKLRQEECVVANIDDMVASMLKGNKTHGCVIDFGGWTPTPARAQKQTKGAWVVEGVYFIRYTEGADADADMRDVVQALRNFVDKDPRLGKTTPYAYVAAIGRSEPGKVNDIPFIMIPWSVEAYDMEAN